MPSQKTLLEMDRDSFFHPFTALAEHAIKGPRVISRGSGIRVEDVDGNSFIDSLGGLWCVNVGYGRNEISEAMREQSEKLSFYHSFASMGTEPSIQLADRVVGAAPNCMSKILFGNSGSDANETNIKLVWLYNNILGRPKKKKIIVRNRAYHGVSSLSAAASGLPTVHEAFDLPVDKFRRVSAACYYWCADKSMTEHQYTQHLLDELEQTILNEGPDTFAAFLAEPISGAGGVLTPPVGYWKGVQEILQRYDILLILDEVITGFGRTGNMFAAQTFDITPDFMSIAKGLTSGYAPMSGSLVSESVWQVLLKGYKDIGVFGHGFTYSAHPLAAAAGLASLDIIERENLVQQAYDNGDYLQQKLHSVIAEHPLVGNVRGVGLMSGVELDASQVADLQRGGSSINVSKAVAEECYKKGLIIRPLMDGNVLAIAPPLVITCDELDELLSILLSALDQVSTSF